MNQSRRQPADLPGPIVVAGHVCLDLIPRFAAGSRLPAPGALTEVGPAAFATGGAVANTGLALHKLGARVRLVALLGEDLFGAGIRDQLAASGAETRLAARPGASTSYSVVLSPPGVDRSFLHSPGANHLFTADDVRDEDLIGATALHFGYPTAMRAMYQRDGEELSRLFARCRRANLLTSLDTSFMDPAGEAARANWRNILRRSLPDIAVFSPSVDELRAMLGAETPADEISDVHVLARQLVEMGAGIVLIKLGRQGIYLRTGSDLERLQRLGLSRQWANRELRSPCFRCNVAGTTGSGDATIAGLLLAALCGYEPAEAISLACAVGGCSVESADATGGIRPWKDVLARLERGWPRHDAMPQRPGWTSEPGLGVLIGPDDANPQ